MLTYLAAYLFVGLAGASAIFTAFVVCAVITFAAIDWRSAARKRADFPRARVV